MATELCTFGPPAERKRRWILKFEDADIWGMYFTDEGEALRAFNTFSMSWTCTLFVTAEQPSEDWTTEMAKACGYD